jgi:hypothetical protein
LQVFFIYGKNFLNIHILPYTNSKSKRYLCWQRRRLP